MTQSGCPGELALLQYVRSPATSPDAVHVEHCAACGARVQAIRTARAEFDTTILPATVDSVIGRVRRPWQRWLWLAPLPVLAAAGVLLLPRGPAPDYVGTRGQTFSFTAFSLKQGAPVLLSNGASVATDVVLRLQLRAATPCYAAVFSIDGTGEVSQLYPGSGEAQSVRPSETVEGAAQLEGPEGPERLVAVCAADPAQVAAARKSLSATHPDGPTGVRQPLADLLPGITQSSILLEKRLQTNE